MVVCLITTTINANLLAWADAYAKKQKLTRRALLERGLILERKEAERAALQAGLEQENTAEAIAFAEWGMDDYFDTIRRV